MWINITEKNGTLLDRVEIDEEELAECITCEDGVYRVIERAIANACEGAADAVRTEAGSLAIRNDRARKAKK